MATWESIEQDNITENTDWLCLASTGFCNSVRDENYYEYIFYRTGINHIATYTSGGLDSHIDYVIEGIRGGIH